MTTETTGAGAEQSAKRIPQPLTGAELAIHRESRANREYWKAQAIEIMAAHPGKDYLIVPGWRATRLRRPERDVRGLRQARPRHARSRHESGRATAPGGRRLAAGHPEVRIFLGAFLLLERGSGVAPPERFAPAIELRLLGSERGERSERVDFQIDTGAEMTTLSPVTPDGCSVRHSAGSTSTITPIVSSRWGPAGKRSSQSEWISLSPCTTMWTRPNGSQIPSWSPNQTLTTSTIPTPAAGIGTRPPSSDAISCSISTCSCPPAPTRSISRCPIPRNPLNNSSPAERGAMPKAEGGCGAVALGSAGHG